MGSINGYEWIIVIMLALLLLGPSRLPEYAAGLARLIRRVRDYADGARDYVREEMGPEFDEVDWRKYDPRRYHPRTIVRNALSEVMDEDEAPAATRVKPVSATMNSAGTNSAGTNSAGTYGSTTTGAVVNGAGANGSSSRAAADGSGGPGVTALLRTDASAPAARSPRPAALRPLGRPSPAPSGWGSLQAPAAPARSDALVDLDAT